MSRQELLRLQPSEYVKASAIPAIVLAQTLRERSLTIRSKNKALPTGDGNGQVEKLPSS